MFQFVSISLGSINNTKQNIMQLFSNLLLVSQLILFILVLSNMARLLSNYLITKIK